MTKIDEKIIRKIYEDFSKGNLETMLKELSEDMLFYIPGRNQVSGTYTKEEFVSNILKK